MNEIMKRKVMQNDYEVYNTTQKIGYESANNG